MSNTVAELVFIPAPGVGHITSTVEIAKLLVNRDQRLSITVLVIKPPLIMASGSAIAAYIESLANKTLDRVSFVELPQDETPPSGNPKAPMTSFDEFINRHCKHVRNVVADMVSRPGSNRVVAGFVIDMFCTGMIDVANEFNVPTYVFFTSNAAFLGFQMHMLSLSDDRDRDLVESTNSDATLPVPSFVNPVPTKVFPSLLKSEGLDFVKRIVRKMREAKAIMVNTFSELETHAIESLSCDRSGPLLYPVGPLLNLEDGAGKPLDDDVKRWLDGQPPASVVFLCFGSMGSFEDVQVKEIAYALERSGHRFLWSLRRPPSAEIGFGNPSDYEDPRVVLPEGFIERTSGIGKVIGWAPQVALLAHRAVGGFVSHCGWNSVLESLWFGVPVATWPMYAEQQLNAFAMVVELGLAVEIKMDYKKDMFNPKAEVEIVTADEIEGGIRRLMADETVRTRVKEMSEKSRAAVAEGGSSYASIECLIEDFMRNIS